MNKFKNSVAKISNLFFKEAKNSPQLLVDMANMEYYMAESYCGRVFIELLQNADDAKSTKTILYKDNDNIYFANDGKVFDENDLISISRSGASDKKRGETIGYRGIGFKSTCSISNEIIIYSNNTFFTFSKNKCAKLLGMNSNEVPTIRIPILLDKVPHDIETNIEILKNKGYSTVFIFANAQTQIFMEEIQTIDSGVFLFLNNICKCRIDLSSQYDKVFKINRLNKHGNKHIIINDTYNTQEWMIINNVNAVVAFLFENGKIIPCAENEAVYHCYLPTLEKSIIPCKINADFSTDPSRKHLTLDEKTKTALRAVANIFFNIIKTALNDVNTDKYKNIFDLFLNKRVLSKSNILLDKEISKLIDNRSLIRLNNGENILLKDYKMFPSTFTLENPDTIRESAKNLANESLPATIYKNIDNVDSFIEQYSEKKFDLKEISDVLKNRNFVETVNPESYIQLMTNVIRETKIESRLNSDYKVDIDNILIKTEDNRIESIKDMVKSKKKLNSELKSELEERLGNSEINWIKEKSILQDTDLKSSKITTRTNLGNKINLKDNKVIKPHITKWRDAEEKCIEIENYMGNTAEDVSMKNLGYDIISTSIDGTKRYIEVKSVKKDYGFTLTNNEYTSAHELGDNFWICLLYENSNKLNVRYIKNPLKNAKFEKRIRQWEWICLEFDFTEEIFDID